jgi:hypothetical protein
LISFVLFLILTGGTLANANGAEEDAGLLVVGLLLVFPQILMIPAAWLAS